MTLDRARILAWIEEEQQHTQAVAEAATRAHLRGIFTEDHGREEGRRLSQLTGRYIALADLAGRIRAGEFDRQRPGGPGGSRPPAGMRQGDHSRRQSK